MKDALSDMNSGEAELAILRVEDEALALQELEEAALEAEETAEVGLDELVALAKCRPGLKITLSY